MEQQTLWEHCKAQLKERLQSQIFMQLILPLEAEVSTEAIVLRAPNIHVKQGILRECIDNIHQTLQQVTSGSLKKVFLEVGQSKKNKAYKNSSPNEAMPVLENLTDDPDGMTTILKSIQKIENEPEQGVLFPDVEIPVKKNKKNLKKAQKNQKMLPEYESNLNNNFLLENFVVGKANQLAQAAAQQIVQNPGGAYNPFFLYGGVGLGKTHLMHAIGNEIVRRSKGKARVIYLHSERFVADMVTALQNNAIEDFKRFYRSMDALLVDDIQFIGNKERSQEEFFHTFNALLEGHQQVILSSDRYPKEISGLEERLRSRFGSGLTVSIEPPELETRVAILLSKAQQMSLGISQEIAFFIAKNVRSNVRELEGALKRVGANAQLTGSLITLDFVQEALRDQLVLDAKVISIENIMKTVAAYYKIRVIDLLSKKRARAIARPRQVAMLLCKELTSYSLPEIGEFFGGRDHTTVIHACKTIKKLKILDRALYEDYSLISKLLSD